MSINKPYERLYNEAFSPKKKRDRFDVEFNEEERQLFTNGKRALNQHKDVTAAKQLMFLGALAISRQDKFMSYFRDTLLINNRINVEKKRDAIGLIEDQIRQLNIDFGRKLN